MIWAWLLVAACVLGLTALVWWLARRARALDQETPRGPRW